MAQKKWEIGVGGHTSTSIQGNPTSVRANDNTSPMSWVTTGGTAPYTRTSTAAIQVLDFTLTAPTSVAGKAFQLWAGTGFVVTGSRQIGIHFPAGDYVMTVAATCFFGSSAEVPFSWLESVVDFPTDPSTPGMAVVGEFDGVVAADLTGLVTALGGTVSEMQTRVGGANKIATQIAIPLVGATNGSWSRLRDIVLSSRLPPGSLRFLNTNEYAQVKDSLVAVSGGNLMRALSAALPNFNNIGFMGLSSGDWGSGW